jgi:beta-barrel assembly-enhancing protease
LIGKLENQPSRNHPISMKKIFFILSVLFWQFGLVAQDFNNYTPMVCSGKIPEEVIVKSSQKYKKEVSSLKKKDLGKSKLKNQKQFALESNFMLDNLMESGLVLFNDPVSKYLNEVAAKLIQGDKKVENVKIYTLRSGSVNAFATDRGTIFVTLGLLSQLENEAQLAFILAHELTHVAENHTREMFLESKEIEKGMSRKKVLSESTFDEALVAKNRYSKELETEADQKGCERFLKTNYSAATIDVVFDVLKYAYLPFDDVKFDRTFLENDGYATPDALWEKAITPIKGEDEAADDKKSSHPNIAARRKLIDDLLAKTNRTQGKNFLISEERFKEVQKIARFELPMLFLHHGEMPEAVYTAWLLLGKEPNSVYLKKCLVKGLYYHAKCKNDPDYEVENTEKDIEGESQQVHRLMHTLGDKELLVLALREAWKLHITIPEDQEIKTIVEDLFVEMMESVKNISEFKNTLPDAVVEIKTVEKPAEEKTKYDKIKDKKVTTEPKKADWQYAFVKYVDDERFKKAFETGKAEYKKREERRAFYQSSKGRKQWAKEQKKERKKGQQLGIKNVVVVNPFYLKLDARKENAVQFVQSETGQEHLTQLMDEVGKKSDLKMTVLNVSELKAEQTDRFNEVRLLNDWYSEQVRYDELSLTPGTEQTKIDAISKKYNTDYFLWMGVISLRERKRVPYLSWITSAIFPVVMPFAFYKTVKPEYDMLFYAILFDVKTGRRRTVKMEYFDKQDSNTLLKAHIFDTFTQIRTEGK